MRRFTLTQTLDCTPDEHWRRFFDPEFERGLYLDHLRFPHYELLEQREEGDLLRRRERVTPRLDAPAAVTKVLGSSFGYVEDGTFDRRTKVWRCRILTNVLADRISCEMVVKVDADGPDRCRRTVDGTLEARIFAIGGLVESVFEKNLRDGWQNSATYMNQLLRKSVP
jgi:hypothetical protein